MDTDDFLFEGISAIIIFLILIACIIVGLIFDGKRDDKLWNDGHCPTCGAEWEYEQAVGHRYSTHYIYMCPECESRIEIGEIR